MKKMLLLVLFVSFFFADNINTMAKGTITIRSLENGNSYQVSKLSENADIKLNIEELIKLSSNIFYKEENNKLVLQRTVAYIEDQNKRVLNNSKVITVIDLIAKKYIIYVKNNEKLWLSSIFPLNSNQLIKNGDDYYISIRLLAELLKGTFNYNGNEIKFNLNSGIQVRTVQVKKADESLLPLPEKVSLASPVQLAKGEQIETNCGTIYAGQSCSTIGTKKCGYICVAKSSRWYYLEGGKVFNLANKEDLSTYASQYGKPVYKWNDEYIKELNNKVGDRNNWIGSISYRNCSDTACRNCQEINSNQYQTSTLQEPKYLLANYPKCEQRQEWIKD
jgi:hypothetical protein